MFAYLILVWLFKEKVDNIQNIYCESVILFILSTLVMNVLEFDEELKELYVWVLIVIVLSALIFCWTLVIPDIVKAVIDYITNSNKKKEQMSTASADRKVKEAKFKRSMSDSNKENSKIEGKVDNVI
jgi:hypothetical protein